MLSGVGVQVPPSAPTLIQKEVGVSSKSVDAGWSSLVARRAHNPKVVGSNPSPATIWSGSSVGLECRPVTAEVAGSSPVQTAIWFRSSVGRAED